MEALDVEQEIAARWGKEDLDQIAAATGVSWAEVAYRARRRGCRPPWRFFSAERCYEALRLEPSQRRSLDRLAFIARPQKPQARLLPWLELAEHLARLQPGDLAQADPYFLAELEETTGVSLPRWQPFASGPRARLSPLAAPQ